MVKFERQVRLTKKEKASHWASPIVLVAHSQGSSNRQGKRSCCTPLTPCLACARSPFLRSLSATPCPTQSPQCGSHCPSSPMLYFLGKQGLYMTQYLCVYVYVCVLIPQFLSQSTVITPRFDKGSEKANSCKFLQVLWKQAGMWFYNYPRGRRGWHVQSQREGRIPTNSSTMGKVSAETHSQPLYTNL